MNALTKLNPFRKRHTALERMNSLARFDPFREMEEEMARLWNRMDMLSGRWPVDVFKGEGLGASDWTPCVDITEDEKEYLVKAELPEVRKSDIKVQVQDGLLLITGERQAEHEERGRKYHRIERSYGKFERSFALPENADAEKITSEFKDGLLTVHLPKAPGAEPKAIEVNVA